MSNGTKVRITRGRHKGQYGTVAGTDTLGRLIIRTTANLPVWVSVKSVKVVAQ
jgi:hypothetical protein